MEVLHQSSFKEKRIAMTSEGELFCVTFKDILTDDSATLFRTTTEFHARCFYDGIVNAVYESEEN